MNFFIPNELNGDYLMDDLKEDKGLRLIYCETCGGDCEVEVAYYESEEDE